MLRVLTQDRPKSSDERQAYPIVNLNLVDQRKLILDGVLDRDDVGGFVS